MGYGWLGVWGWCWRKIGDPPSPGPAPAQSQCQNSTIAHRQLGSASWAPKQNQGTSSPTRKGFATSHCIACICTNQPHLPSSRPARGPSSLSLKGTPSPPMSPDTGRRPTQLPSFGFDRVVDSLLSAFFQPCRGIFRYELGAFAGSPRDNGTERQRADQCLRDAVSGEPEDKCPESNLSTIWPKSVVLVEFTL